MADVPDLAAVKAYLGVDHTWSDADIADALAAETAAQSRRCLVTPYEVDLGQALKRRVARNLAARAVQVTTYTSFEGGASTQRVPTRDPEINRLEGPFIKAVVA